VTRLVAAVAVLLAAVTLAAQPPGAAAEALRRFINAANAREAESLIEPLVASGVSVDAALAALKAGRTYATDVPRGTVAATHGGGALGALYYFTLDVPQTYDPSRKYPVRVQLHGGVGRIERSGPVPGGGNARLQGAEQIYVMPSAWRDAPWWSGAQVANLLVILDRVKRTYNVDENRVTLAGVSDGGTGAYYMAMRETTPFASFLPFIGFIGVLKNELAQEEGDVFPNNLLNKPLFIVNGGRDPQYPTSMVSPFIEHLEKSGVPLVYRPRPEAAHDTSWWPALRDEIEAFAASRPRQPLPDRLTWESGTVPSAAHWLVIDRLAAAAPGAPPMPDVNRRVAAAAADFGIRASGTRINRVAGESNAAQIGLRAGDTIAALNNQPLTPGTDVAEALRGFPAGRPLIFSVRRGGDTVRITGRYNPTVIPGDAELMLPPSQPSGRVDVVRAGNRVDVTTRGVGGFRLLLSPDQFDFAQPVTVVVDGRQRFSGVVQKDLRTLLTHAAQDNDRTMLFAAELRVALE
jgi:hypothetical protein